MKTTVGRVYRFRATHSLPGFSGVCKHPHEHDYTFEVVAVGDTPTEDLDDWWWGYGLEDRPELDVLFQPSTVENIARNVLAETPISVLSVTVWEDRQRFGRAER